MFSEARITSKIMFSIAILFLLFGLAWFIVVSQFNLKFLLHNFVEQGNIWVFSGKLNVQYTNPIISPNTYCNRVVYLTGYGSIIVKYIFAWIITCRLNCYLCSDVPKQLTDDI